ncbi:MAG TPA: hypothetical protein VK875_05715 [Euzebyales bacterium]|nr:hypothetical protein [Euzebyales bacterium]
MGAVVVALVAIGFMLLAGVFVAALRLVTVVRQLIAVLEGTRDRLEPMITELRENGEIASLEVSQLQSTIASLNAPRRPGLD